MLTSRLGGFARSSPWWSLQMPLETPPPRNAKVLPDAARDGCALRAGLKAQVGSELLLAPKQPPDAHRTMSRRVASTVALGFAAHAGFSRRLTS